MESTIPLDNLFDAFSLASDGLISPSGCAVSVVEHKFFHDVSFLTGAAESTWVYFTGAVYRDFVIAEATRVLFSLNLSIVCFLLFKLSLNGVGVSVAGMGHLSPIMR
jgi:hypothetical protein